MKKILLAYFILLSSIYSANGQRTVNLNLDSYSDYEEINSPAPDYNFNDALRFRELKPNDKIQYDNLIFLEDIIQLDLFNNKQYKAVVDKVVTDVNGTLLVRAKLEGFQHAYCFISTYEGKSFMVVEVPENNELYMTRYNHTTNTYHLLQMDKTKLNEVEACFGKSIPTPNKIKNGNKSIANSPIIQQGPTTRDTITLLVVYTAAASTWSTNNEVSINNTINLMMAKAELTNDNSDSLLYIQLVHSEQVSYVELKSVQDLFNLRNTTDGNMDSVHTTRDTYCADLVTLLEETNHTGGTAYLLNNTSGSPSYGFSILRVQQASWTYTAIHEFGHNLGCGHNKNQNFQAGPGIFSYSAGGRWVSVPSGNYCSVMSYTAGSYYTNGISHTRVAHFSNPSISYLGTPTGDSLDADNARSIRTTKATVAGYRTGCDLPAAVNVSGKGQTFCDSAVLIATGGDRGTIYWQDTISGDTSTASQDTSRTVTTSGTYFFRAKNLYGWGPQDSATVTIINNVPSQAGTISGATSICKNQSETYAVPLITGATSYTWTLPSGVTGRSFTDSITVNFTDSAVSGDITVTGTNACGNGGVSTLSITVNSLPANAGSISGATAVCPGQSETYAVPAIADATSYVWTLPTGATGTSTSDSITVNFSNSAAPGDISILGTNTCGNGVSSDLSITINPFPAAAGTISGLTTVCQGGSETYAVPAIADATSYVWTLPSGATGTSTTDSITVNYSDSAVSGDITVLGTNSCGNGVVSSLAITIDPLPASAGTISGLTTVCQGGSETYAVPAIADATSYVWTLPSGATGTSTSDSITVNFSNSAISGDITVLGTNSCGNGIASTLSITLDPLPANAGSISGSTTVCQGVTETYAVPTIADATSYVWTLPSGATGMSTTDSITVNYSDSAVSGNITVLGTNSCGNGIASTLSIGVDPLPANAGSISGLTTVCQGGSETYAVPAIADATSYVWTLPSGATGTSNSDSITINFSNSAVSGDISVLGANTCGNGIASTLSITLDPLPANAGSISGLTTVCQGQSETYSVAAITDATSYLWSLPSGINGSSSTNSINIIFSDSAVSGDISVLGANTCGNGVSSDLSITVDPIPTTPTISMNANILQSDALSGNQWYDQNGLISGATNQSFTVTANGDYYARVTLLGCSSDTSNTINVISTGIEARANDVAFKVFPNPFSNEIIIEIEGDNLPVNLQIINIAGQVVYSDQMVKRKLIQTGDFAKGIYFIKLENEKFIEIRKIIRK